MIRLFIIIGVVTVLAVTYLATFGQGRDFQMPPRISLLEKFEAEGLVPNANALTENEEVEHETFEVPPEDEKQLAMVMENMANMDMSGMNMDGMTMEGMSNMEGEEKPAMKMKLNADGSMAMDADGKMIMEPAEETAMKMEGEEKPAMKMKLNADGSMALDADGNMVMEPAGDTAMKMDEEEEPHGEGEPEGGLVISEKDGEPFDREIKLTMSEWDYSNLEIEVKTGERIRFIVTNGGKIPHEFMFMDMLAMAAVNYRASRADWSLLEHEALYEKSLVLPGGTFTFVAEIKEDGAWMFMCMLPFHMQMGMMGQMATPGRAMAMPGMRM